MNPPDQPTPRTNAEIKSEPCTQFEQLFIDRSVPAQFARTLERELAAMTARAERAEAALAAATEECKNVRLKWHAVMGTCAAKEDAIMESDEELARLRAENLTAHQMACAAGLERDQLRSELAEAKVERETVAEASLRSLESYIDKLKQFAERAEKAEAECLEQARLLGMSGEREADLLGKLERLAKDKARLDWLESPAGFDWQWNSAHSVIVRRAAIDAAMKP
jgi:chromosome segregation ATPase